MVLFACIAACASITLEGVTFADRPQEVYVVVREAAKALGWEVGYDPVLDFARLRGQILDPFGRQFSDGTRLISLKTLKAMGMGTAPFQVVIGKKRVVVDLTTQRLRAWQGSKAVYDWPISSGREGKATPTGSFVAGIKEKMHLSTLYGSPMPFSVHVVGNIFIHGSDRITDTPGSHGCIRLPLSSRRNCAEEFFHWIEPGTPIKIVGAYDFGGGSSAWSQSKASSS